MNNIEEFNNTLAESLIKYDLSIYFNTIHSKFYKNVNITFMDYFLSLIIKKNEFCVDHIKLQEYKVINNIDTSANILKALNRLNLEESIDYQLFHLEQQDLQHGGSNKKEYKLTPNAFKLCLIRAKNSKEYAKYYLMLEEIFYYYREYQNKYQLKLLSMKDDKIDQLLKDNKEQSRKMDKQSKQIEELLGYAKQTKDKLDKTNEKLDETNEELNDIKDKFGDLNDKVDDIKDAFEETAGRSVPDPANETDKSEFVLLQSKMLLNEFTFMRGIQSYNEVQLNKKYSDHYIIIKREYNANPVQLFRTLKEIVKEQYKLEKDTIKANKKLKNKRELYNKLEKIKFNGNKILLNEYTLNDLLDKIKEVSKMKYKEYKESTEDIP